MERPAKMTIILGTNGTGKTTLLENILQNSGQKSLVITPDDIEWQGYDLVELDKPDDFVYSGIRRHIFSPAKNVGTLDKIEYFKKGILVFDDCRAYLHAATDERIRQLIIRRRQRMVDVFAVGHGFTEVPPVFFTFSTDIILFRTTDNIARRKDCLKDFDKMAEAQARVNKKAAKNPHYYERIKIA
jgi:hypothetical protein